MKFDKIFICSAIALSVCNCSDDNDPVGVITPAPGKEVVFGASLDDKASRTIYGPEGDGIFPIYWENGDEVKVYSPQGAVSEATYKVTIKNATGQDYASSLDKVTDAGIQWGTEATADFYSVYPAGQVQAYDNANKKVTVRLPHMQDDYIRVDDASSTAYTALADMKGGFLFAQTLGVANGTPAVELGYKPISTALRFTLTGPTSETGSSANLDEVNISDIVITAPSSVTLAGNFDINFPTEEGKAPTYTVAQPDGTNTFNRVTIYSSYKGNEGGAYLTLKRGESIELNAFIIPQENVAITDEWTIEVHTSIGVTFSKKLGAATGTAATATTLKAGEIHRLPTLPALDIPTSTEYDPSNWMVNIPRNTYLSEISIPGSWNSMNGDFQTVTDLAQQYAAGVRAFHLDTRWKNARNPTIGYWTTATGTLLPGLPTMNDLAIADGGTSYPIHDGISAAATTIGRVMSSGTTAFADALSSITSQVKDDEYMVVLVTFAQGSYPNSAKTWMQAVSEACANNSKIFDGSKLSEKTVVGDVLGSVIVIVNCESAVSGLTLPADSKCVFTYAPLTLTDAMFSSSATYNKDVLYNGSKSALGITLYNTQAQITAETSGYNTTSRGYAPTLTQREDIAKKVLDYAQSNYADQANYKSENWMYLGLGGYLANDRAGNAIDGSYATVASTLNNWVNSKITNMSSRPTGDQTNYYPVGIILMNYVNNATYGTPVVNNILQLNNKFQKAYNPDWTGTVDPVDPASAATSKKTSLSVDTDSWNVF